MQKFPFLTLKQSLLILRIAVAVIFLAHAIVRICNGTIPRFGEFMESKGLPFGVAWVWGITAYEIAGGLLLLLGMYTRLLAAGFIVLLLVGIVLIHASLGWFVGEHGTGGCEYSVILIVALLVVAAEKRPEGNV
jgi:putative oxidoreductase